MCADRRLTVTLEIEPDAEPIAGRLRVADGIDCEFTGWIRLTRLLDELLADASDGPQQA